MKKVFPIALIVLGIVFAASGVYTVTRGLDAKDQVRSALVAQNITTPDDASIPGVQVNSVATAKSMAEIIDRHARDGAGGLTYSEMGRFMTEDGEPAGTDDAEAAATTPDGKPVPNPARNTAFQSSALQTSLYASVMGFEVATLVMGLGAMIAALGVALGGVGVAFAGLVLPTVARRVHVQPVAA